MTGNELLSAVRAEIYDPRGTGHGSTPILHQANKFVRRVMATEIARNHLTGITGMDITAEEITLVSGTAAYTEPSDLWLFSHAYRDGQKDNLIVLNYGDLLRRGSGVTSVKYIARNGGNVHFRGTPSSAGTVYFFYYAQPTAIAATDDEIPGGGIFDDCIVEAVSLRLHMADRFGKYDINAEAALVQQALAVAGFDVRQQSGHLPKVSCATWNYRVQNRESDA